MPSSTSAWKEKGGGRHSLKKIILPFTCTTAYWDNQLVTYSLYWITSAAANLMFFGLHLCSRTWTKSDMPKLTAALGAENWCRAKETSLLGASVFFFFSTKCWNCTEHRLAHVVYCHVPFLNSEHLSLLDLALILSAFYLSLKSHPFSTFTPHWTHPLIPFTPHHVIPKCTQGSQTCSQVK